MHYKTVWYFNILNIQFLNQNTQVNITLTTLSKSYYCYQLTWEVHLSVSYLFAFSYCSLGSENAVVIANTLFQQHKRRIYTWTSPDGQYWYQIDYILCSQRWRSSIQSAKTRPGADHGSDHEVLTAKFRLKLKKVGKTTRAFWYDLNQIPYNYTVEMTSRFKGFDLIKRVPEELWTEVCYIVQEAMIKDHPQEK